MSLLQTADEKIISAQNMSTVDVYVSQIASKIRTAKERGVYKTIFKCKDVHTQKVLVERLTKLSDGKHTYRGRTTRDSYWNQYIIEIEWNQ